MDTLRKPAQDDLTASRQALAERISRWTESNHRLETAIPGLALRRFESPTDPASYLHDPSICLVAQGAKRVLLGDEEYVYDANNYLITSVGLPVVAHVTEASQDVPLLGLIMKLDLRVVSRLLVDSDLPIHRVQQSTRAMAVSEVSPSLLNAFIRLVDLLDEPTDIPILSPLLQKEIVYRLIVGGQGINLRQIAMKGSHGHQVTKALDWLKENYSVPLRVDELASRAGMSASTFHHHFRSMTAMSPLQFQKWMRLHEARRVMLSENQDATTAAFLVGYESPSQLNREYKRKFGAPPLRDIKNLHQVGHGSGNVSQPQP